MEDKKTQAVKKNFKPGGFNKPGGFRGKPGRKRFDKPADDFEQKVVDLARVTRVMAGGKRMKFRACMVVGDKKGQVGVGLGKARDVSSAIKKGVRRARKNLIRVSLREGTIPHQVLVKNGAARVLIKPAPPGTGLITGGAVRAVAEVAGVKDMVSKILGTRNKASNVYATIEAFKKLRMFKQAKKKVKKVVKVKNK